MGRFTRRPVYAAAAVGRLLFPAACQGATAAPEARPTTGPAAASTPTGPTRSTGPTTASGTSVPREKPGTAVRKVAPPPAGAEFDYQIGEAYPPADGVTVVVRDRAAAPVPGLYNVCYVNAYQAQPIGAEVAAWRERGLLLTDGSGQEVVDEDWDEVLLDIRTAGKRAAVAQRVNAWVDDCAAKGFQAIEPDNLDSYARSGGLLDVADAVALLRLIVPHAHRRGLAVAQKNAAGDPADGGIGRAGKEAGLDFAVAEECGRYDECGAYRDLYGDHVLVVEYTAAGFARACREAVSVVLRDVAVSASAGRRSC